MSKVWAWIRRSKPLGEFKRQSLENGRDEAIIAAANKSIEGWFFAADAKGDGLPNYDTQGNGALYVEIWHDGEENEEFVLVRIRDMDSLDGGVTIYKGPLKSTEEDVFEFWSKMVSDKLIK